jgi:hypothetical protein
VLWRRGSARGRSKRRGEEENPGGDSVLACATSSLSVILRRSGLAEIKDFQVPVLAKGQGWGLGRSAGERACCMLPRHARSVERTHAWSGRVRAPQDLVISCASSSNGATPGSFVHALSSQCLLKSVARWRCMEHFACHLENIA